jgi:hypothetical protein
MIVPPRHSGAQRTAKRAGANPESRSVWLYGDSNVEIPGSVPSPAASVPPRNDECGTARQRPNIFSYLSLTISLHGLYSPRPAPPRGAIAIVTFAGWDAVDAGDAASRGSWGTSVFGQDGSAPALPLARRRPTFGWKDSLDSVTDDQVKTRSAQSLEATLSLRPGTLILVMGPFAMADVQATEKTPHAERRAIAQRLRKS